MTRLSIALATVCAALPSVALGQEPAPEIVIRNVTVVDGTGALPSPDRDVWISGGHIEAIVPAQQRPVGRDTEVVEGEGGFLLPGLIDAHVHVDRPVRDRSLALLEFALRGGVTSVRDMAGDARTLAGLSHAVAVERSPLPTIYYSALMAGPEFIRNDPRIRNATVGFAPAGAPYMQEITTESDIALAVAVARGTGATGIKLYADVTDSVARRVIVEARRQGIPVWAHGAVFPAKPLGMIRAGVAALSHAPYVIWEAEPPTSDFTLRAQGDYDRIAPDHPAVTEVFRAMAEHGTVLDPTLFVWSRTEGQDELGRARARWAYAATALAHELGVLIAAGTDALGNPGTDALPNVHTEMELLVREAGFTPLEALRAATLNGARAIGVEAEVGSIEVGKTADLVLLSADPTLDIRNTRRILQVLKSGRLVR